MAKKTTNPFKRNRNFQVLYGLIVVVGIVAIGFHIISSSHAQSPYASSYAGDGQLAGGATLVSGGSNSNGQAVQFEGMSSGGSGSATFGIYQDGGTVSNLTAFDRTTGVNPTIDEVYEDGSQSSNSTYISSSNFSYTNASGTNDQLLIGMNMCSSSSGSLAAGAAGSYNSAFTTFAQNMVNEGFGNAIIRMGVEIYGNWEACYITNATDAANYATYFQQAVNSMRSVSGQSFKFDWEVAIPGNSSYTAAEAYPGDAYVDYIGFDTYDETWVGGCGYPYSGNATVTQSQCAWNDTILPELTTVANFASAHNKLIAIPEWGLSIRSDGGGLYDDPDFIDNMNTWIKAHNVGFDTYFNSDSGGQTDMITDGNFPKSLAEFEKDF